MTVSCSTGAPGPGGPGGTTSTGIVAGPGATGTVAENLQIN